MKEAFAYIRVSGLGQREGDGPGRQAEVIEACAKAMNLEVRACYWDVVTGDAPALARPAFGAMIASLNGVQTIIVERLERLARDSIVAQQAIICLAAQEITLIAADTQMNVTAAYMADPMQRAIVQMQTVMNELFKNMMVAKLRHARERIRHKQGKCEGRKGYGERPETAVAEQEIIRRIRQLRQGGASFRTIASTLNAEGVPTRSGRPWHPGTIHGIVNGRIYKALSKAAWHYHNDFGSEED